MITMLQPFRRTAPPPKKGTDEAEALKWAEEARQAEDAENWARAVVCYRRALGASPFSKELRAAFEDALEELIYEGLEEKGAAAEHTLPGRGGGEDDWEDEAVDFDDEDEEEPAPRRKQRRPRRQDAPKRRRPVRAPRRGRRPVTWVAAAALAIVLTTAGLFAASAASSALRNLFGSDALPAFIEAKLPEDLSQRLAEADSLLRDQQPHEAAEVLRETASMYPEYEKESIQPVLARAVRSAALSEYRNNRYAEAAELFEEATELDPQNALNWIDYGRALREQGRGRAFANKPGEQREVLTQAEKAFERALALSPNDTMALFGLAQVHAAKNNRREAIDTYKRLLALAPDTAEGRMARTNLEQLEKR